MGIFSGIKNFFVKPKEEKEPEEVGEIKFPPEEGLPEFPKPINNIGEKNEGLPKDTFPFTPSPNAEIPKTEKESMIAPPPVLEAPMQKEAKMPLDDKMPQIEKPMPPIEEADFPKFKKSIAEPIPKGIEALEITKPKEGDIINEISEIKATLNSIEQRLSNVEKVLYSKKQF